MFVVSDRKTCSIEDMHRLRNPGKTDLKIIEIKFGNYLGEDDIARFDDQYGRHGTGAQ